MSRVPETVSFDQVNNDAAIAGPPQGGVFLLVQGLLAGAAVVLAGMLAAYFENIEAYSFSVWQLAPWLLLIWLVSSLGLFGLAWLLTRVVASARYWFLPGLTVLLWLQGPYNLPDYGPMDGAPVDWSAFNFYYLRELVFVAGVAVFFWLLRHRVRHHVLTILAGVLVVQTGAAGIAVWQADRMPHARSPAAEVFRLSESHNVFLIILDAFQADVFKEIITRRPEYREALEGFVFWPDSVGLHPTTYVTIPALFFGEPYRNEQPYREFSRRVYSSDSVLADFRDAGYQVDLFPRAAMPPIWVPTEASPNIVHGRHFATTWRAALSEALVLFEFALFRHGPQLLRRVLYREGAWSLSPLPFHEYPEHYQHRTDIMMLAQLRRRAFVEGDQPVFRFIHVFTPHLPVVLDAEMQPRRRAFNRESFVDQAEAALKMLLGLLETLEREGVYDNSRIMVVADHGRSGIGLRRDLLGLVSDMPSSTELEERMALASPLFLTKDFNATGRLRMSHAPVHLQDVARSLADVTGAAGRFPGYSVFSETPPAGRPRYFYDYRWQDHGWGADYLVPITEYRIQGHAWMPDAWSGPLRRFGRDGAVDVLGGE